MNTNPWENMAAGSTWRGWWRSAADDLPALPVLAARGRHDGPTLLVTGGVHGDEYEGPAAITHFFDGLDVETLYGRVIAIPVVNISAWQARARHTPADGGDLNRSFAQSEPEGQTTRLAQVVYDRFVGNCDVLVDLHSGGVRLNHLPLIGWYRGGSEAERLARRFGAELHPWLIADRAGVLSSEAHRLGKVALGAEWRGGAVLDQAGATAYAAGLQRLQRMISEDEFDAGMADTRQPIAGQYQETEIGGIFTPCVTLGQRVAEKEELGILRDELGVVTARPQASRSGIVAALPHLALLLPGDRIAYIG